MGVLRTQKGIEVRVKVDSSPVAEYDCSSEDHSLVDEENYFVKYIESEPGLNFSVEILVQRKTPFPNHSIAATVHVDGQRADEYIFVRDRGETCRREIGGVRHKLNGMGVNMVQRFRFHTFTTVSSAGFAGQAINLAQMRELGEIKVTFTLKSNLRTVHSVASTARTPVAPDFGSKLPEEAVKGRMISSRTRMDKPKKRKFKPDRIGDDVGDEPIATFIFLYRTVPELKKLGVFPSTPPPIPLEERDPEDLNPDERLQVIRLQRERMQAMGTANVQVKTEMHNKKIKREPGQLEQISPVIVPLKLETDGLEVTKVLPARLRAIPVEVEDVLDVDLGTAIWGE